MLSMLRKRAQSTVIQGLVLLIAIVFIFWGVGSNLNQNRNSIAVVNGTEISLQDFQRSYDQAVERYRQQFGGQIPPGLLDGMGLKQQVLAQLIRAELIRQGGAGMGIGVSDAATQHKIEKMKVFTVDGKFNLEKYNRVLRQNKLTPVSFEEGLRSDILASRVTELVGSFAVVPDDEVQAWIDFVNEEIRLGYISFKGQDFEDKVKIDDAELAAWYEKNRDAYKSEPAVRLKYLFFPFDRDAAGITVTDEEVAARYEREKEKYRQPEQRHARHILFRVTKNDSDTVRAEKEKKAEEVLSLVRKGGDFSALAEKYSEDPTRSKGGDLGFFTRTSMVKPFADAVFSMKPGQVSGIVETPFGYHIIKLEEIRPARTRPLDEVKESIHSQLKQQKAQGITFKRASTAYEEIMRAGSLDKYGSQGGEKVVETDYFTRTSPPAGVTANKDFLAKAFALHRGELSSLVRLDKGYAIIYVDDIREPKVPELKSVRDRAVADYKKDRAVQLAREAADKLLALAREKGSLSDADSQLKKSGYVKRSELRSGTEPPAPVFEDAFSLAGKNSMPEKPVAVGKTFYVYQILDRRQGEEKDEARKKQLQEQLLVNTRNKLISDWLTRLQADSEIWTNNEFLK